MAREPRAVRSGRAGPARPCRSGRAFVIDPHDRPAAGSWTVIPPQQKQRIGPTTVAVLFMKDVAGREKRDEFRIGAES